MFSEETVLEGAINEDDILGPDTSVKKKVIFIVFLILSTFQLIPSLWKLK